MRAGRSWRREEKSSRPTDGQPARVAPRSSCLRNPLGPSTPANSIPRTAGRGQQKSQQGRIACRALGDTGRRRNERRNGATAGWGVVARCWLHVAGDRRSRGSQSRLACGGLDAFGYVMLKRQQTRGKRLHVLFGWVLMVILLCIHMHTPRSSTPAILSSMRWWWVSGHESSLDWRTGFTASSIPRPKYAGFKAICSISAKQFSMFSFRKNKLGNLTERERLWWPHVRQIENANLLLLPQFLSLLSCHCLNHEIPASKVALLHRLVQILCRVI